MDCVLEWNRIEHLRPRDAPSMHNATRQRVSPPHVLGFLLSSRRTSNDTRLAYLPRPTPQVCAASIAVIPRATGTTPLVRSLFGTISILDTRPTVIRNIQVSHVRFPPPLDLGVCSPFHSFLLYLTFHCRTTPLLVTSPSLSRA